MSTFDSKTVKKELSLFHQCFDEISKYKLKLKKGEKVLLNPDFNMLYPVIWPSTPQGVPPYKNYGKNLINLILNNLEEKPGFKLYFTLPSFLELLDSFHHHAKDAESLLINSKTYDRFKKSSIDDLIFNNSSISSRIVDREFEKISRLTDKQLIKNSLDIAKSIIGSHGPILGIDDLIHQTVLFDTRHKKTFDKLFKLMLSLRGMNDTRDPKDKDFHYKIDVSNIMITIIVNELEGHESRYITNPNMISQYCLGKGLNAEMPYIWLSSHLMCKENPLEYGEHSFFIDTILKRVNECINIVSHYEDKNLPDTYKKIIHDFYCDYIMPIHGNNRHVPQKNREIIKNENKKMTFDSYMEFKQIVQETREEIENSVKDLINDVPYVFDEESLNQFDLKENPVISEIRKDFNL